jgi:hypothetical protein
MVFIETENLDSLFHGIESIIGTSIEHMVITAVRRAVRPYLKAFVLVPISEKIRHGEMEYKPIVDMFGEMGGFYGYGKYDFVDLRYEQNENDYCTYSITEPYSLSMTVAAHVADVELLTGIEQGYRYEDVSPDVFNITAFPSPHLEEMKERLRFEPYRHRDAGLELERCTICEGPMMLSGYKWFTSRGIIASKATKRRMAMIGSAQLDPIFQDLEDELGSTIPQAVVEAQRRFTKSGFYAMDDITEEGDFRTQLALRGLGNLQEIEMGGKGHAPSPG